MNIHLETQIPLKVLEALRSEFMSDQHPLTKKQGQCDEHRVLELNISLLLPVVYFVVVVGSSVCSGFCVWFICLFVCGKVSFCSLG